MSNNRWCVFFFVSFPLKCRDGSSSNKRPWLCAAAAAAAAAALRTLQRDNALVNPSLVGLGVCVSIKAAPAGLQESDKLTPAFLFEWPGGFLCWIEDKNELGCWIRKTLLKSALLLAVVLHFCSRSLWRSRFDLTVRGEESGSHHGQTL